MRKKVYGYFTLKALSLLVLAFLLFTYKLDAQASIDYPLKPWDQWMLLGDFSGFGAYRSDSNKGYHSGIDISLKTPSSKDGLNKPVYAIADGELFKVDDLKNRGWSIVLKHTLSKPQFIIPEHNSQDYQYKQEKVSAIYSVYIHITPVDKLKKVITEPNGVTVKKGEVIGHIMEYGGVPHLHFEIRHPDAKNSNKGSMLYPTNNWAPNGTTNNNGHYLNMQKLIESGARNPLEFLEANVQTTPPSGNSNEDLTEANPKDFFPLTKGTYWIYKGVKSWKFDGSITADGKDDVGEENVTLKMEIVENIKRGDFTIAILKGYPIDVFSASLGDYLIIRKGSTKFYLLIGGSLSKYMEQALRKIRNNEDFTKFLDDENDLFLDLPLDVGKTFGSQSIIGGWEVEAKDKISLDNVKGILVQDKVAKYRLTYSNNFCAKTIEYVAGIGIIRFQYEEFHINEDQKTDLKLVEYGKGQVSVPVDKSSITNSEPIPTITKVEPRMASAAGGTELTITGTGFKATPTVTIGGNPATGVKITAQTTMKVTVPPGVAGPADIVVANTKAKVKSLPFKGFSYYEDVTVVSIVPDLATAPPEGIDAPAKLGVTFNQDIDPISVVIKVIGTDGAKVAGKVVMDTDNIQTFYFIPTKPFKPGVYTMAVSGAKGMAGNVMYSDYTILFKIRETESKDAKSIKDEGKLIPPLIEYQDDGKEIDEYDSLREVFNKNNAPLGVTELLREAVMIGNKAYDKAYEGRPIELYVKQIAAIDFDSYTRVIEPSSESYRLLGLERSIDVTYDYSKNLSISETITRVPKKEKNGAKIITVPGGVLNQGTYIAYYGPFSMVLLDENKKMVAVLINDDYYLVNEIVIAEDHILAPKAEKISEEAGIVTANATLKKGIYLSFNGSNAAFLFNKEQLGAALIGKGKCKLYIATKATEYNGEIGDDGLPKSLLNVAPYFVYKAMLSEKYAVILDKEGKPIHILGKNQKTVIDSDPATWAYNDEPSGEGLTTVTGYPQKLDTQVAPEMEGKDGAPMVLIPAEQFQMGDNFNEGPSDEQPAHTVYLDSFYIDKYEVTNAQYKKFVQATGRKEPEGLGFINGTWQVFKPWQDKNYNGDNQPVVCVTWEDANAYAKWAGKRLPTEAEWEKAAKGGLVGKRFVWGNEWPPPRNAGNFADISAEKVLPNNSYIIEGYTYPTPVGRFTPNGYGLYDMEGNVGEWCADWYDRDYYAKSPKSNPTGPSSGQYRVLRGGSWPNPGYGMFDLRVVHRNYYDPTLANNLLGFRCCIGLK